MTDQETNRKLALAIGWSTKRMWIEDGEVLLLDLSPGRHGPLWRVFDYRDWRVAGPIAQRYDCFPFCAGGGWCNFPNGEIRLSSRYNRTPQEAIAMAVIEMHQRGRLK